MQKLYAIQLKAAFLLIIFSLNMVVGFACSIGANMVGNIPHHSEGEVRTTHTNSHQHGGNSNTDHHAGHKKHNHNTDHVEKEEKKGCCNHEVQKVQQLDKNINSTYKSSTFLLSSLLPLSHFQVLDVKLITNNLSNLRDRFFYPPPPNILVELHRFQI